MHGLKTSADSWFGKGPGSLILLLAAVSLQPSCGGAGHGASYDDGYAAGYDGACGIRSDSVAKDWSDKSFAEGYRVGHMQASVDCATAGSGIR
jgi:hypothetical protein